MANLPIKTSLFFSEASSGLTSIAAMVANADVIFTGYNREFDIDFWTDLEAAGFDNNTNLGHYGKDDNGDDPEAIYRPGAPAGSSTPRKNTIAFEITGDMANVRDNVLAADSSTWPLRYLNNDAAKGHVAGEAVTSQSGAVNKYIHMDVGKLSYRLHFKQRFEARFNALPAARRPGFIWLDNGRDNPYFTGTSMVLTQQYPEPDGSAWFAAKLDWYAWLIQNVCIPNNIGLAINMQTTGSEVTRFKQYIDVMSTLVDAGLQARTFIEFFASTSTGNYEGTLNLWKKSIEKMAYAESRGVITDCCVQLQGNLVQDESNAGINERARFTLASFLLAMGRSTLRYSDDDNVNNVGYGYFNIPPLFAEFASIRQPTGKYYSTGTGVYRRDFVDGGYVICDYSVPATPTYQIVPGVGTTKKPLVTQLDTDLTGFVTSNKVWQVFAEAQDGGALTYSLQSGSLPTGKSLDSSTGRITGTYSAAGTFSGVIRVSESGGGFADTAFTFTIDPAPPVPTSGYVIGFNFGGPQLTMENGDVFETALATTTTGVGFTLTANGATNGSTAAGIELDASVPTHWSSALFTTYLNDAAGNGPVADVEQAANCDIRLGFMSGSTPAGRIVDIFINGNFKRTINFADWAAQTAFVETFPNEAPVDGGFTIEARRNASATVSARIMCGDMVALAPVIDPPVWDTIGDKTTTEGIALAPFTVSATADTGTAVLDAQTQEDGPLYTGSTFVDNGDGTGTFTLALSTVGGVYPVTFIASDPTDPNKNTLQTILITVNEAELPAVDRFEVPGIGEFSAVNLLEGQTLDVEVYVTDPNELLTEVVYAITPTPPSGDEVFATRDYTGDLDPAPIDTISLTPQTGDGGTYVIAYTVRSAYGPDSVLELTVNVTAPASEPDDIVNLYAPHSRQRNRVR